MGSFLIMSAAAEARNKRIQAVSAYGPVMLDPSAFAEVLMLDPKPLVVRYYESPKDTMFTKHLGKGRVLTNIRGIPFVCDWENSKQIGDFSLPAHCTVIQCSSRPKIPDDF